MQGLLNKSIIEAAEVASKENKILKLENEDARSLIIKLNGIIKKKNVEIKDISTELYEAKNKLDLVAGYLHLVS